jgi:hypothetical protein
VVPLTWPPEFLDSRSLEFILARLAEGPERQGYASEAVGGLIGEGSEPGIIRFELGRAEYSTG